MPKKGGYRGTGRNKKEDTFWKRYEGGLDAGYMPDEAAAIAHGGSNRESLEAGKKAKRVREEALESFAKKLQKRTRKK
jgi:hypothetical protein